MALIKVQILPGIDKQNTEYGAEGRWVDCDNVRFRYGLPEKMEVGLRQQQKHLLVQHVVL